MPRTLLLLLPALSLAACGDATPQQANVAAPTRPQVNVYQQKLLGLSEVDRTLTLRRAVQDDGGRCARIQGSGYQQDYKGMAMWVASCSGTDWAVFVGADGSVQARLCSQERQLGLPECRPVPKMKA